jgi:hypothetical protein
VGARGFESRRVALRLHPFPGTGAAECPT